MSGSTAGSLAGLAMAALRLPAREVWAMTPREIALALRALDPARSMPPARSELAALMTRFPDSEEKPQCPSSTTTRR